MTPESNGERVVVLLFLFPTRMVALDRDERLQLENLANHRMVMRASDNAAQRRNMLIAL